MSDLTRQANASEQTRVAIREFVTTRFPVAREHGLKDSDSLLESGVVDSLGVLDVAAFLEDRIGVRITDDDLNPENFDSIDTLVELVRRRT